MQFKFFLSVFLFSLQQPDTGLAADKTPPVQTKLRRCRQNSAGAGKPERHRFILSGHPHRRSFTEVDAILFLFLFRFRQPLTGGNSQ